MTDVELGPDKDGAHGVVQEILPPLNTVAHAEQEIGKDMTWHSTSGTAIE
jgi:hypothetical protein